MNDDRVCGVVLQAIKPNINFNNKTKTKTKRQSSYFLRQISETKEIIKTAFKFKKKNIWKRFLRCG